MIENIQEIKDYIESNSNSEDVKGYVTSLTNLDGVKNFLETNEDGKKYLGSYSDSRVTKGIETFKQNNLNKLVQEEMKKLNPTLDERDLKYQALERKFEESDKARTKETLTNKAMKIANEKHLPQDLVSYFLGSDETSMNDNLNTLEKSLGAYSQKVRDNILKEGSHVPSNNDTTSNLGTITQAEYDQNKNDLDWYAKNKAKVMESYKRKIIK